MEKAFENLKQTIRNRRTVKPARMNGKVIEDDLVFKLMELADWAPTHGRTEPWRFVVFSGKSLIDFSEKHAKLYRQYSNPANFKQEKYNQLMDNGDKASHLIIMVMKRTVGSKIKEREEYAAVAASLQNILLGATALDLAAMWNTGGMVTSEEMKFLLGLAVEDSVVGFLYLGYSEENSREGIRKIPLSDKIKWNH